MSSNTDELRTRLTVEGDDALGKAASKQKKSAEDIQRQQERMMDTAMALGGKMSQAGDMIFRFAQANVGAAKDAALVDAELRSMYQVKGFSADQLTAIDAFSKKMMDVGGIEDEVTKKSATLMASFDMSPEAFMALFPGLAAQAKMVGMSVEQVSTQIGKAFASGQYGMLRKIGVTLDYSSLQTLKYAQALAQSGDAAKTAQGKQMALRVIQTALEQNTPRLSDRLKTATGQQERFNAAMGELSEGMGQGVMDAQKFGYQIGYNIIKPLMGSSLETQKTLGWITYLGGGTLKLGGSFLQTAAEIAQFRSMMILGRMGTIAAAGANTASVPPALAAAGANTALGISFGTVALGALAAAAAIAAALLVYRDYKVIAETNKEKEYSKDVEKGIEKSGDATGFVYKENGGIDWEATKRKQAGMGIRPGRGNRANQRALDDAGWQAGGGDTSFRTGGKNQGTAQAQTRADGRIVVQPPPYTLDNTGAIGTPAIDEYSQLTG